MDTACKVVACRYVLRVRSKEHDEWKEVYRGTKNAFTIDKLQTASDYSASICALSHSEEESRPNELAFSTFDVPDGFAFYPDTTHVRCSIFYHCA